MTDQRALAERLDLEHRLRRRTSSGRFLPEVDGLRFLAIAPVVLHHLVQRIDRKAAGSGGLTAADATFIDLVPSGELGVTLFFVISGFIICLPLATQAAKAPDRAPVVRYGAYLVRRLTRLEPPYLLVLFGLFAGIKVLEAAGQDSLVEGTNSFAESSIPLWESLVASTVYMHGLVHAAKPRINPPAWSLEIEFQFYVLAPALILLFLAVGRRLGGLLGEVAGLIGIAVALKGLVWLFVPEDRHEFLVAEYVTFFLLGFLLSRLYAEGLLAREGMRRWATPAFLVGIVVAVAGDQMTSLGGTLRWLIVLAGFAAVFAGALSGGVGQRFTSLRWISIVGGMCYTIYLLHLMFLQVGVSLLWDVVPIESVPVALLVYGALLIPPLMVVCAVFFILVEKPCMDPTWPKRLWGRVRGERTPVETPA